MGQKGQGSPEAVGAVSEFVGAFIGTAVVHTKRIISAGKNILRQAGPAPLSSELTVMQKERMSLLSDLKDARKRAGEAEDREALLRRRLSEAQRELEQARDEAKEIQFQLAPQLSAVQDEKKAKEKVQKRKQTEPPGKRPASKRVVKKKEKK